MGIYIHARVVRRSPHLFHLSRMRLNHLVENSISRELTQSLHSLKRTINFCEVVVHLTWILVSATKSIIQGHNCVWHNQLPGWVTSGNFDKATLESIVETHCGTIVGHYKGQM